MKAGYVAPMSIAAVNGGLRTQAKLTVQHIREFGVEPVLLSPWDDINRRNFDLIHVFGATIENIGIVKQIKALEIPIVLSTVLFSNRSAGTIRTTLKIEKILSPLVHGFKSEFNIKAEICSLADLNFPNTRDEAHLIEKGFSIPRNKISVIPNGVEEKFQNADPKLFFKTYGIRDFILFAGQAGAERKNIIKLLEAASGIEVPIVIIGSLNDDEYGNKCRILAEKTNNVTFIEPLDHDSEMLSSAYAASKVFVLPSQYETPGIAAMEAALTGSNIVITERGGTKEYFGKHAYYINPNSTQSLLLELKKALAKENTDQLKEHILSQFTWQKLAEQTANQYKKLLK
ncbi:MAG: glycosyltransferase family 4 protein [Balneolaceae bacterium]